MAQQASPADARADRRRRSDLRRNQRTEPRLLVVLMQTSLMLILDRLSWQITPQIAAS